MLIAIKRWSHVRQASLLVGKLKAIRMANAPPGCSASSVGLIIQVVFLRSLQASIPTIPLKVFI
jgi:hypothetical protein